MFQKGDPIVITEGHKEAGKTGTFKRYGSNVFPYWCSITLDLVGRQRVPRDIMIEHKYVAKKEETA